MDDSANYEEDHVSSNYHSRTESAETTSQLESENTSCVAYYHNTNVQSWSCENPEEVEEGVVSERDIKAFNAYE